MKYRQFKIMGILNITPDSFSDGGKFFSVADAMQQVELMVANNVDIIDIGGESTRPNAIAISPESEISRVLPIIIEIRKNFPSIKLSIDTTKYDVAKAALDEGVEIINDISGLQFEPRFLELASEYDAGLVIMHIKGTPRTMQGNPKYDDVVKEVYDFLADKVALAKSYGLKKLWIDPGIGFGKTYSHNIELLKNLYKFNDLQTPLLLGLSRKSFLKNIVQEEIPENRDLATALIHSLLLSSGVDIVRVHNVMYLNTLRKLMNAIG